MLSVYPSICLSICQSRYFLSYLYLRNWLTWEQETTQVLPVARGRAKVQGCMRTLFQNNFEALYRKTISWQVVDLGG